MIFSKTDFAGIFIIEPEPRGDNRGYFERIYCQDEFRENGIDFRIVQMNQAFSKKKGTIRGPHMQKGKYSEKKLMRCIKGSIFDVVIDVRKDSETYGKWMSFRLSEKNQKMLYIPKGIMHGYQALENNTVVQYPVSEFYSPDSVVGVRWNDPLFKISWPIKKVITSEKDKAWGDFTLK